MIKNVKLYWKNQQIERDRERANEWFSYMNNSVCENEWKTERERKRQIERDKEQNRNWKLFLLWKP